MDQNLLGQLFPALNLTPELIERLLNNNRAPPIVPPTASIPLIEILRRQMSTESSDEHRIDGEPQQRHASGDSNNGHSLNLGIGIGVGHQPPAIHNFGLSPDAVARALTIFNNGNSPIVPASAALQPIGPPPPSQVTGFLNVAPSGSPVSTAQHPFWGILQTQINLIGMAISQQGSSGSLLGVPALTSQQFGLGQGPIHQSSSSTSELPSPLLGGLGLHTPSESSTSNVAKQLITTATNTESDEELRNTRIMLETVRRQLATAIQQNGELIQENHRLQDNSRDLRQDMEDLARENHLLEQDHFHSLANYQNLVQEYQSQEARLRAANATLRTSNEKLKKVTTTAKAVRVGALRIQLADQEKLIDELTETNEIIDIELFLEQEKNKILEANLAQKEDENKELSGLLEQAARRETDRALQLDNVFTNIWSDLFNIREPLARFMQN